MTDEVLPFKRPLSPIERRVAEVAEALADWTPPSKEEINNPHLINVRCAWLIVMRDRDQSRKVADALEAGDLEQFLERIIDTAAYLKCLSDFCALAVERVLDVAGEAQE
jgi:hypothetical protein